MKKYSFLSNWRARIYNSLLIGTKVKFLIVNKEDLIEYENELASLSPGGIIAIDKSGYLKYKNIPLAISEHLNRGECELEIEEL